MILPMQASHIEAIAKAQMLAWQSAFRGILSDHQLDSLSYTRFVENWRKILGNPQRHNLVKVSKDHRALGFVSWGPCRDNPEMGEIYGLYVHPDWWRKGIGQALMLAALEQLTRETGYQQVCLWVMQANQGSRRFYEKMGFSPTGSSQVSQRNGEAFVEVCYAVDL